MGLNPQTIEDEKGNKTDVFNYRKKIKGFHLAFSVHEPLAAATP